MKKTWLWRSVMHIGQCQRGQHIERGFKLTTVWACKVNMNNNNYNNILENGMTQTFQSIASEVFRNSDNGEIT